VLEKLDLLMRFWELRARHARAGEPLGPSEQLELLSLMQLVTGDMELPQPGALAPSSHAIAAQLIGDGVIAPAEIRRVSAAGVLVSTRTKATPGARFIVKAADAIGGVEYTLPCKVIWSYGSSPSALALAVDGVPTCTPFGAFADAPHVREGVAQGPTIAPSFMMGRHERLVG
jgi:hypothetical protein